MAPLDMEKMIPCVTGGGSGIGLGLVKEFVKRGSPKVLITGRRKEILKQAVEEVGEDKLFYKVSDAGKENDREELLEWIKSCHPDCNVLVNNAGIQRRVAPVNDTADWVTRVQEIEINLHGPIHLTTLFIPYFLSKKANDTICVIATVTSGLAFIPFAGGPVYSATKAALHNYIVAMRYSLQDTNVRLVEIAPPAVKTNLGGNHDFGEELGEYAQDTMEKFANGDEEIGFRMSEMARNADRATVDTMVGNIAAMLHVPKY